MNNSSYLHRLGLRKINKMQTRINKIVNHRYREISKVILRGLREYKLIFSCDFIVKYLVYVRSLLVLEISVDS